MAIPALNILLGYVFCVEFSALPYSYARLRFSFSIQESWNIISHTYARLRVLPTRATMQIPQLPEKTQLLTSRSIDTRHMLAIEFLVLTGIALDTVRGRRSMAMCYLALRSIPYDQSSISSCFVAPDARSAPLCVRSAYVPVRLSMSQGPRRPAAWLSSQSCRSVWVMCVGVTYRDVLRGQRTVYREWHLYC